ncbi:MAG: phage terminase small subunit P27 family [Desulfuromonadaceae bacterium]
MAGRKPKPTYLKLITGNPGKRALNKNEPMATTAPPRAPQWLDTRARAIFKLLTRRLVEMGYASASHTESLALAAWRLSQVETCAAVLDRDGYTFETTTPRGPAVIKARPEVALMTQAAKHAQSLLNEFGLTPASATRVQLPGKPQRNPFNSL